MVNIAVVGYGYWGPNLVRNFAETPGARVAAVADLDPARLALVERRFPGVKTTTDLEVILADQDIDAVAVATPAATHFPLGMRVLQAGKHLWLEKPMTETSEQAQALNEEARRRGRVLIVDHTFVYTPAVRKMAELIGSGEIGDVYYYDSTRVNLGLFQRDVSVICDLAVHDFAILDYLLGRSPQAVSASGMNHFPGTPENLAFVTLFYDGGTIGHVNVSWLAPVKVRQIMVGGSRRMIAYDDLEPSEKLRVYDKGVDVSDDPQRQREMRVGYRSGDMWAPRIGMDEALRLEGEHFVDCIGNGKTATTDGEFGLRMVRLIEAANRSMRRKGETTYLQEGSPS
ncbi:MAG: Gfo/Idh/MocA family protein [Rubrivivax sp.]